MTDGFKSYEIAFLVKNPEDEKVVVDLIGQYEGNILQKSALKETRLSYPIKKHASAYFGYVQFKLAPLEIEKLSQSLKLSPAILRYLAVASPLIKKAEEKRLVEDKKSVKPAAAAGTILTNEALEEKLEEILK